MLASALPWGRLWFISVVAALQISAYLVFAGDDSNDAKPSVDPNDESQYLYSKDYGVVTEYRPKDDMKPSFLYTEYANPRIVEFYAPWCPHCQHFRDHYVEFGGQVTKMAQEHGVKIEVHAVSCTVNKKICHDFGVHGYPTLKLFTAGSLNATASAHYWELHPSQVLIDLGIQGTDSLSFELPDKATNNAVRKKAETSQEYRRTKEEIFDDAYLSFYFALKNGIYMTNGPLTNSTHDAFQTWVYLLQKSMPPTWKIQKLVKAIITNWKEAIKGEEHLLEIIAPFEPANDKWSTNSGYTQGLWTLFHIITVGVVEWNRLIGEDYIDELAINTPEASKAIRNYIEHFFACEECRTNFILGYDSCSFDRCNRLHNDAETVTEWSQLPLWLFEVHNSVNVRLLKERGERENWTPSHQDEVDKTWPRRIDCPKCWRGDGWWDEEMIHKYLRLEYWPEDSVSTEYREELFRSENFEDDDSYWKIPKSSIVIIQLAPFVAIAVMIFAWHRENMRRRLTGLHKKVDLN